MGFGIFIHRADSIYEDSPAEKYQFPSQYLRRVETCVADWIIYYEPRKVAETRGYFAIAKVRGGMAAMTGSVKLDTTYATLGLRGAALTGALTARGTLGWRYALGDVTPAAVLAFQPGGAAFSLAGTPIARDALVAEAGLDLAVAANASLGVSWSGQFADQSHSNAVKGNFSWRF